MHIAALDHIGEQQCRENFGEGTDLKNRISIHRTRIIGTEMAVSDDTASLRSYQSDNNANALLTVFDALRNDPASFWNLLGNEIG